MKFLALFFATLVALAASGPIPSNEEDPMQQNNLFEGDIAGVDQNKGLAQLGNSGNRWPKGIVPYVFEDNVFTDEQKKTILSGMNLISDKTRYVDSTGKERNCITFVPRTTEDSFVRLFSGSGCWSYVGRVSDSSPQDLSLKVPPTPGAANCIWEGTVAHEFLHALGFWHEQSRPDRDDYVRVLWDNISPGTEHNFNKYETNIDLLDLPYDYKSIMHYEWNAFSKNGKPTIEIIDSDEQLLNAKYKTLSDIDIKEIKKYYNCQ